MAIRIGINGFGRIGRQVYRAIRERYDKAIDVVAVIALDLRVREWHVDGLGGLDHHALGDVDGLQDADLVLERDVGRVADGVGQRDRRHAPGFDFSREQSHGPRADGSGGHQESEVRSRVTDAARDFLDRRHEPRRAQRPVDQS